ncbi:MAG: CPBP family intramembrane glutamic endopeptidase [Armatimonadota bacterium]
MKQVQFPSVPQSLLLILMVIIGQSTVMMLAQVAVQVWGGDLAMVLIWSVAVGNLLALGVTVWVGWLIAQRPVREVLPFRPVGWAVPVLAVLVGCTAQVLLSELDNLTRLVFPPPEAIDEVMRMLTSGETFWGSLVALVIVAPLTEEALFRGVLLQGFRTRYRPWAAALWSALLFGLIHLNPWQFLPAVLLGLFFAWLVLRTRSLLPAILTHAAANSLPLIVSVTGLSHQVPGINFAGTGEVVFQPWWLDASAAVVAVAGIFALWRLMPCRMEEEKAEVQAEALGEHAESRTEPVNGEEGSHA